MRTSALLFRAELVKTRKSWAMLAMLLAPVCQAGFLLVILWFSESLVRRFKPGFQFWIELNYLAWNLFFLPITAALIAELSWGVEAEAKAWNHLLVQPVPHGAHFLAKFSAHLGMVAVSQAILALLLIPGGALLRHSLGALMGDMPAGLLLNLAAYSFMASLPLVAFHTWWSVRNPGLGVSFVIALVGTWGSLRLDASNPLVRFLPWGMTGQMVTILDRWKSLPWGFVPACLATAAAMVWLGAIDFARHKESKS